ncbi:ATP synthase subunit I [Eikenella sp. S3360]|uniref:ATP synthase subunit I n=1 Tax=Eikenella glucosivorans TaxID=2766967 RepID=A0ABS0NCT6_9NEIS|nr:ATP synthase subunit I [Eikenella glucosivorans]MBH5330086.1 ATP synthase subunit I [Eikenella glucosivorans]
MAAAIWLQLAVTVMLVAVFWVFSGAAAAESAALGCLCYLLPTVLAVLVLRFLRRFPKWRDGAFWIGEGLKIVLAVVLMTLVFVFYRQRIVFVPFILGLIAVSHAVLLIFWKARKYGQ